MKILAIALNDLTHSFRSAFAVGMMLVAPLVLTGLIYFAFGSLSGGDVSLTPIRVGVVNADVLPPGAPIAAPIGDNMRSMFFDESVASWIEAGDYPSEAAARAALDQQAIGVAIIIPAGFTERYLAGADDAPVLILSDPTLSLGPAVVQDMVTMMVDGVAGGGIALQTLIERERAQGREPDPALFPGWIERYTGWYQDFQRKLFHSPDQAALVLAAPAAGEALGADPVQQMMGLTMAGQMIFFACFTGAYAMLSILREAEDGTLARFFTTSLRRTHLLLGKFLAVLVTVIVQGLVLLAAGHYAFGITWGQPASVALALTGQVVAAAGLGVLLIAFVKSTRQGGPVLGGALTVLGMLGGLFTANIPGGMPAAFNAIANFVPQGWVLRAWRLALAGQPPADLLVPFTVVMILGVAMFVLGALMFRKRYV
jgi:ABC-2 type transport system permease protein